MSALSSVLDPVRRAIVERTGSLRAAIPPVAVEIGAQEIVLARVKRSRRKGSLEALEIRALPASPHDTSSFLPDGSNAGTLDSTLREMFTASHTRPGKLSLVVPDSLAKVSVLPIPERPTSARQLSEMVRFKLRRSVPFRLEDAAIAHQLLPDDGGEPAVLVAVVQRSVLDPFEKTLNKMGTRPGMVGLATIQLFNLYREELARASESSDAAFLNCTPLYFSLLLVRKGRLIFFRCKPYGSPGDPEASTETMSRELATSFSYYEEKLAGQGIGTAFLRTVAEPVDELVTRLNTLGVTTVEPIDLSRFVTMPEGKTLDQAEMHRVAPAVAAALGGW